MDETIDGTPMDENTVHFDTAPVLETDDVSLRFGERTVLESVSLTFRTGEFVGIIGPNGSGKTSLLRLLDGIYTPDRGTVALYGRRLSSYAPKARARSISFMMQDEHDAVTFTTLETVLSGRYPYRKPLETETEADLETSREKLAYVGLSGFEHRRFDTLSTGEKQLVLFARTLVQDTAVVLLDEPTSNLDIAHQQRIFSMARDLAKAGKTVIAAIHGINEAARYCTRLVLLDRGTVAADGKPSEVVCPAVIDAAYGIRSTAVEDPVSGAIELRLLPDRAEPVRVVTVHLVGGDGSARELTRRLYREGCNLTGSPVPPADPDAALWSALQVPFTPLEPFHPAGDAHRAAERAAAASAELTVICVHTTGPENSAVLKETAAARHLLLNGTPKESLLSLIREVRGEPPRVADTDEIVRLVRAAAADDTVGTRSGKRFGSDRDRSPRA